MLGVLFLRKEQFHILLCFYDFLHLIPCLSVLWVECFFLGEQSRILCIPVSYTHLDVYKRQVQSGLNTLRSHLELVQGDAALLYEMT